MGSLQPAPTPPFFLLFPPSPTSYQINLQANLLRTSVDRPAPCQHHFHPTVKMKAAVILSLASLAFGSVLEQRACAGNNCNRQVTGTRAGLLPLTARQADCSSFQLTVVTPSPTTVTVTVTEEPAAKLKRNVVEARQATSVPTNVPAYASSCNAVKYASACDCWGITAAVSTAPTPTVTVTTTVDYCEDL
ncbi:hypothetical protein BN1708_010709 [Verticillium longisporum]|uniref:Uncharacterized protein n=1 Tax=Verticillium longisporum TaxID=100787 RepID=A0A0G4KT81_VERLO|nr:hypothetical protein BN1708_010709 [Verticillium longisporum]